MTFDEFKGYRLYYGAMKSLFNKGRSEVEQQEPEMLVAYDQKHGQAKYTTIYLLCVFVICAAFYVGGWR